jgi:hypothetical protein
LKKKGEFNNKLNSTYFSGTIANNFVLATARRECLMALGEAAQFKRDFSYVSALTGLSIEVCQAVLSRQAFTHSGSKVVLDTSKSSRY